MAKEKSTRSTKTTTSKAAEKSSRKKSASKMFAISVHLPGSMPKSMDLAEGATLGDVIKDMNLDGYDVTLNGEKSSQSTSLSTDDIIRVGVKTKNA